MTKRPWTPNEKKPSGGRILHVKRCCEQCGREVGDVTDEEMEAAVNGCGLPPVADECGCSAVIDVLAKIVGPAGAHRCVRELVQLGWGPVGDFIDRMEAERALADARQRDLTDAIRVVLGLINSPGPRATEILTKALEVSGGE